MSKSQELEWNAELRKHLLTLWDEQRGQYYRQHYIVGQGWTFFDWLPVESAGKHIDASVRSHPTVYEYSGGARQGQIVQGSYDHNSARPGSQYESLDPSFLVRNHDFFQVGKVFAVLFSEPAGMNAVNSRINHVTNYNSALSQVRYNEYVHTQVRRFIVVRQKRGFCYAVPIFTYNNQGTKKPGVEPEEHTIAYSHGSQPQLLPNETTLSKSPIPIVMADGQRPLPAASRIYFGIHHPIQYNVKVKELGYVHPDWLSTFLGYWHMEHDGASDFAQSVASTPSVRKTGYDFEEVRNPHNFFKIARVFMTPWTEPDGSSGEAFTKIARFVVVKPGPTFSICLRISTYSGQATTKHGVVAHQHAAVIPQGGQVILHEDGEYLSKEPIEIKVENEEADIKAMSRINFAKPYTIEHRVKVCNVGRVVGDSVKRLERYFAESLGFTKTSSDDV